MRQRKLMLMIFTVLTLGLASFTASQIFAGMHGDKEKGEYGSEHHSKMMGGDSEHMNNMMGDMSQHYMQMSDKFDKLESHFEQMMQIEDMSKLKAEMKKHHDMMKNMHEAMKKQDGMWDDMMTMVNGEKKSEKSGK